MMRGFGFGGHMGLGAAKGYGFGAFDSQNFWIPMLIGGILKLIIIIAVIYILYRLLKNKNFTVSRGDRDHALAILKERYAKGEINEEEYLQRKELLTK